MENHKVFHSFPARCVLLYWMVFPDVSTIQGDFSQEIVVDWNGWVPSRDGKPGLDGSTKEIKQKQHTWETNRDIV